jgi:hypothetical protein
MTEFRIMGAKGIGTEEKIIDPHSFSTDRFIVQERYNEIWLWRGTYSTFKKARQRLMALLRKENKS